MENITKEYFQRATSFSIMDLEKICQIRIATALCNKKEILNLILKCDFLEDTYERLRIKKGEDYQNVLAKAYELLSSIPQIRPFKDKILEFLWPLSYKMILWKSVYVPTMHYTFVKHFYWTNHGRIDNKRTAQHIIKNDAISVRKRFLLACSLCLSEDIQEIWKYMFEDDRFKIWTEYEDERLSGLLLFWVEKLKGNVVQQDQRLNDALECAINIQSLEAVKYLFSIIPENAKSNKAFLGCESAFANIRNGKFIEEEGSDVGYFLFSQLSEVNQKTFLKSHYIIVLFYLLYSPGQNEFIKLLKENLAALDIGEALSITKTIFDKIYLDIFKDYDYCELFICFWKIISDNLKEDLKDLVILDQFFCMLISEDFRFVLEKITPTKSNKRKRRVNFNHERWKLILFFLEEEIVTSESLMRIISEVIFILEIRNQKIIKEALDNFLNFVDNYKSDSSDYREYMYY